MEEYQGLTTARADALRAEGKGNDGAGVQTKSIPQIVRQHTFTLFNFVNVALAVLVLTTGSYRNLLFILVAVLNTIISVVQEVRSKQLVDQLAILAARDVTVVRDGAEAALPADLIVLGDLIVLRHGDQVPADARVVSGVVHMHEGLLTGESVPVEHGPGEELLSGSFVDSGSCHAQVIRVGSDSFANRMTDEAKQAKVVKSEIMSTLSTIIRFAVLLLVPIGVALFARSFASSGDYASSVLTTVAAVVGMIPQGLILLTSSVLAIATQRLARKSVLVQQLYCIEQLARVDTLCLDKTGTITSGRMEVDAVEGLGQGDSAWAATMAATIAQATSEDANATTSAILQFCADEHIEPLPITRVVPFSSARKYSGCVTAEGLCFVLGAAQFVLGDAWHDVEDRLRSYGPDERVLVLANADGFDDEGGIVGSVGCAGFVAIRDEVRPSARQTMDYFTQQGVALKVISGDDPATVSAVATTAGVPHAECYVDASTLETDEDVAQAMSRYTVFGRVTPQQKRAFVHALQAQGHSVAMTGDGVNDVLALHDADCAVAMASGSDAARNIADIVLVDDDFSHMPEVVAEGRRSINNLQRSAALFLVKTVWSAFVAAFSIIMPPFPMQPIQMSLVSGLTIGYPSFVLALEPNHDLVQGHFLTNVLIKSLPASIAISVSVALAAILGGVMSIPTAELSVVCLGIVTITGIALIVRLSLPFTPLRRLLLGSIIVAYVLTVLFGRTIFFLVDLSLGSWLLLGALGIASLALFWILYDLFARNEAWANAVARLFGRLEAKDGSHSI